MKTFVWLPIFLITAGIVALIGCFFSEENRPIDPSHHARIDAELRRAWQGLHEGRIAYNPQRQMLQGQTEIVRVRISEDPKVNIGAEFDEKPIVEFIKTSASMTASLEGSSTEFTIQARSSASQPVVGRHTDWIWKVTPLKAGQLTLHLRVTARLRLSDRTIEEKDVLVKETRIQVTADPTWVAATFWESNWRWLLGSPVIVGALLWLAARVARKRKQRRPAGFR